MRILDILRHSIGQVSPMLSGMSKSLEVKRLESRTRGALQHSALFRRRSSLAVAMDKPRQVTQVIILINALVANAAEVHNLESVGGRTSLIQGPGILTKPREDLFRRQGVDIPQAKPKSRGLHGQVLSRFCACRLSTAQYLIRLNFFSFFAVGMNPQQRSRTKVSTFLKIGSKLPRLASLH